MLSSQKHLTNNKTNKNPTQNRKKKKKKEIQNKKPKTQKKPYKTKPTHVQMPHTCKIFEGNEALDQMSHMGEGSTSLFCPQIV